MKAKIQDLKNKGSVICYIEMLQSTITRMNNQSGIIKASMCVVYTIVSGAILTIPSTRQFWWIDIVITLLMATVDAYYLGLEKSYRDKYNIFVSSLNKGIIKIENIYDMNPKTTELKCETLARTLSSFKSFSIIGFYGIFMIIGIIIKIAYGG